MNDVPAYAGFAAVDLYVGATAIPDDDPRNKVFPGEFKYGGGHVIEDLVAGKDLRLVASAYGTDCYPGKKGSLGEVNYAQLKSGEISVQGKSVLTGNLSSYPRAVEIANTLKEWIQKGDFLLGEPVAYLPGPDAGYTFKPLKQRPIE